MTKWLKGHYQVWKSLSGREQPTHGQTCLHHTMLQAANHAVLISQLFLPSLHILSIATLKNKASPGKLCLVGRGTVTTQTTRPSSALPRGEDLAICAAHASPSFSDRKGCVPGTAREGVYKQTGGNIEELSASPEVSPLSPIKRARGRAKGSLLHAAPRTCLQPGLA